MLETVQEYKFSGVQDPVHSTNSSHVPKKVFSAVLLVRRLELIKQILQRHASLASTWNILTEVLSLRRYPYHLDSLCVISQHSLSVSASATLNRYDSYPKKRKRARYGGRLLYKE